MGQETGPAGLMIAVVGASGVGKDSLINAARAHFAGDPRIAFVRRVITRPADGATEDHIPASPDAFAALETSGGFAVSWSAHGLHYGIPADTHSAISAGKVLIANGSRAALAAFQLAYPSLVVIEVTARPEVIAARLAGRGRESQAEIEKRLRRDAGQWHAACRHVTVDNSGNLDDAVRRFIAAIETLAAAETAG
jgi:ribose 1,5-bisphosphokinase